VQRAVG